MRTPSAGHVWETIRACSLALLVPFLVLAGRFSDGPPEGHTGGFGEPTCADCHMDYEVDSGPGSLSLEGLPERVRPGATYELRVVLRHAGMERGGFQIAARTAGGLQAGALEPVSDRTAPSEWDGVTYVSQTEAGSFAGGDSLAWTIRWTATDSADGAVLFHAAANAANGDDSPFEDYIYTSAWTTATY